MDHDDDNGDEDEEAGRVSWAADDVSKSAT